MIDENEQDENIANIFTEVSAIMKIKLNPIILPEISIGFSDG